MFHLKLNPASAMGGITATDTPLTKSVGVVVFCFTSSAEFVGDLTRFNVAVGEGIGKASGRWNRGSAAAILPIPEHRRVGRLHRRCGRPESPRRFSFSERGFRAGRG